jgi:hypothetical protein
MDAYGIAGTKDEERWRSAAFSDWNQVEKALNFCDIGDYVHTASADRARDSTHASLLVAGISRLAPIGGMVSTKLPG